MGGMIHLRLNTNSSPIANKYREGKVQSTLERELNVPETAVMQAYGTCAWLWDWVCPGELACAAWCFCAVLRVLSMLEMRPSSRSVCQHGFVRGQKHLVASPSGEAQGCGLCADCYCGRELSLVIRAGSHSCHAGMACLAKVMRLVGSSCCVDLQGVIRPVLKHGPRSPYTCASM